MLNNRSRQTFNFLLWYCLQIGEKEDRIAQLRNDLDKATTQVKNLRNELSDVQQSGRESNTQLVSLQAKHKETVHQLSEHSKAAAQLKAELERVKAVNTTMQEDVRMKRVCNIMSVQ